MSDQIKVAIKVRPLIEREQFENQAWSVLDNTIFQIDPSTGKRRGDIYKFDHIFDTFSRNEDVFDTIVKPLVEAAVGGFNATIFAYGQTSSGKTYTMSGDETECGVIQMAISHMFETMKQTSGREFLARASHLEIYNEKVRDLLGSDKTNLKIREAEGNAVVVSNLKEELVADVTKTIDLMKKGERKRRVGETAMNEKSSRSHSIFRIIIESRDTGEGDAGAIQVSQLNFVDLAGSERVNQTGAQGERLKEGCSINRSLFMLGHVISQLSEGQRAHINFRDSKLTRILQPSLGGNALTVIICTVTPAAIEETHCTLGFASRAKKIKNEPHLNEVLSDGTLLKRYARQLSKLKAELEEAKASNYAQEVEAMENKLEEKDKHNRLLQARIDLLTEKLISGVTTKDRKQAFKRRRTWCAPSARLSFLPFSLARIDEVASPSQEPVNILESSLTSQFQTPLEEFELQLLSAEVDSVSSEPPIIADVMQSPVSEFADNSVDTVLSCPHVTSRSKRRRYSELSIDLDSSPAGRICHAGCQTDPIAISPEHTCNSRSADGTPRNELRERISFWKSEHDLMTMEYDELREYTRLETDVIRDLYEQLEKSKQEVMKTQEENIKAKMRIHELEELNRQSNRKWETLDMEFLSDVPATPEGKEPRQLQEENIPYNEIIAEKETANQLLEEQLRHMSVVMAEINDTKNRIVSQKDKEILALQEEMSSLKINQEAHKQELVRLQELVAESSLIIEDKDKMILHLEDKLTCFLSDSGAEEIVNNEMKRLSTSLLEKNQEILALQDQILLLNTNFSNEKIMLQDEIAEREQRICNLEEQLTSMPSVTATKEIGDDLKTKIADLESVVLEKNKLIEDLEEQVSLLNTKATGESKLQEDVIQCSLAEKEQKIIELEEKLLHSSSTIATATETMNKLENEISNLRNIISEKTEELNCLQEKISLPNISVTDEKLQVSTLSEEIAHLSLMIKEKDQRIIDLEERLLHASSVTTAAETLTEMENEIANLKNVISDKNREILALQNQISQDTLTERLKEDISVLQGEIAKYCITVREKDQKIFDLEEQVLHMSSVSSSTATELENEVISLKEVISEKNKELHRLLDEKAEQSVVIADKEQKILSLERQLLQAPSFIMTADTERELENEVSNAILDSKEIANHSVINEEEQKIVELEQLSRTSSVPFCTEAMSELQNKIAYLENIISRKNEENLILQEKISNTGEKHQASGLLELSMSSITSTAETVTKLEKEITTLRNVISEKNCEIVALQDQISLVANTDGEKQEVPALQEEIAQQRLIIQEKESRIHDLEDQLLTTSSVTPSAETAVELKNKVANLMDVISEKNEMILALQDQIESLSSNIDGQRKETVRLHEEAAQYSETIKEKEQDICDMREQLSCLSSPITTMKSVNELENKITRLRNIISEKEHEILTLQNYKSLVSTAEGQEEEAIVMHQEKDQNYIQDREQSNVKKEPLCSESSDSPCIEIVTELEKEVAHLKNIISEKNGEVLVFRDQVSSLRQKLELNRLQEEIALHSVIIKDKDQRIIDLEEQISHMSSILSATDPVPKLETETVNGGTNRDIFVLEDQVSMSTNAEDEVHEIEMSHSDITYEKDQRIIELEKQLLQISSGMPSDVVHNETCNKHKTEIAKLNYAILQKDKEILSLKEKMSCGDITCKMEGSSMSEEETLFSICKEADQTYEVAHMSLNTSESEEISMPEEEFSQRSVLKEGKESILDLEAELKNALTTTTDNHYVHNLETEISNMKTVINKKNEEILVLKEQMCALNTNAVSDQEDLSRLKEEFVQLSAIAVEKDSIILELKEQLSNSCGKEELCSLKEEVTKLSALAEEKEHNIVSLKEQLSLSCGKEDLCRLKEEVAHWFSIAEEKERIIERLKEQLSVSCDKEALCRLKEEVAQFSALAEEKEHNIVSLKEQLSLSCGKEDLCRLKEEVAQLSALTVEKDNIILDLKEQLSVSCDTEDLCRLKEEVAQLSALTEEKERIIVGLKEQLSVSCDKEDLCRLKEEVAQLSALTEEKERIIVGLKEQLSVSCDKEDLCRLKEEVAQLSALTEEKERIIVGLKEQLSVSCDTEDLCRLKEEVAQLSALTEEKERIIVGLKEQLSVSCDTEDLCRLKEEVAQLSALTEEKERIIVGLKEQLSVSCDTEDLCRLKEEVAQLSALTEEKDNIILNLKEQLSVSCGKEELCRLREEVTQWCALAEEKERIIVSLKEQLSLSCDQEDLCRLKEEVARWSSIAQEKENIIEGLKEQVSLLYGKKELHGLKEDVTQWSAHAEEKEHIDQKEHLSRSCDKEDLCRLKEEVAQWSSIAEEKERIIEGLKEQLSASCGKEDLCRLKEEVAQLSALAEEKEHHIVSLKEQLSLSCGKEDLCRLKEEVAQWSSIAEEKEHMIEGLKEQLSLSCGKEDLCRLKEEVAHWSSIAEEKDHIIEGLKEQLSVSCDKEDLCRLKEEVAQLSALTVEKDNIILDLKEQLSVSCDTEGLCRLKEEVAQLSALTVEKDNIILDLKEQLSVSCRKEDLCRLKEEVVHWSSIAEEKEHIIEELKEQLSLSCNKEDLCRLKEEVAQLSACTVEKDNIILDLKEQLSVSSSKEELCRLREEVTQWCALAEEKEHIIAGLKEQLSVSCGKEDLCRIKEEVVECSSVAEEKEHIIVSLKEELSLSCGKEDLCRLKEEVAQLSALAEEKEHHIVSLKEQLSLSCGKEDLCRLKEEVAQWSSIAEEKEHMIEGLKEQLSLSCGKEDLCRLKEEVAHWSSIAEEKDHIIEGLKEQLSVSCDKEDLCRLKEEVAQLSALTVEKDNIILDLKEQLSVSCDTEGLCRLKEEVAQLSALAVEKDNIILDLKEQLSVSCRKEDLCRLKEEVAHWSSIAEEKEHIIEGLKEQLSLSCNKEDLCRLKEEVAQLSACTVEKDNIILDLKEQLSVSSSKEELCRLREEVTQWCALAEEKEHIIAGLKEQLSVSCGKEEFCRLKEEIAQLSALTVEKNEISLDLKEQLSVSCGKEDLCRIKEEVVECSSVAEEKEHIIVSLKEELSLSCGKEDLCRLKEEVAQWSSFAEEKERIIEGLKEQLSASCGKEDLCRLKEEVVQLSALAEEKEHHTVSLKEQLSLSCGKEDLCRLKEEVAKLSALAEEKEHIIVGLKEELSAITEGKDKIIRDLKEQLSLSFGKEDLCSLKEEIAHRSSLAEEKEHIIEGLKEQLSLSCGNEDLCRLKEEVAQLSALTLEKDNIILDLKEQLEQMSVICDKEELCRLKEEVAQLSALTEEKDNIIQDLKEQLPVSCDKEELTRLKEEVAQWSTLAKEKECIIVGLKEQLSCESDKELEAKLISLNSGITQKDTEIVSLKEEILSISTDMSCKMQETVRLQEEIAQLCTAVKEKNETIKGLEEQLSLVLVTSETVNNLEAEIDSLNNVLSERSNKVQEFEEDARSLTVDLTSRNEVISRLEEELAQLSTVMREKEQKIFDLELELRNSSTTDNKFVHDLEHEISNLKTIISEKDKESIALQEQISMLHINSTSEKQELGRLKEVVRSSAIITEEKDCIIIGLKEQLSVSCETVKELESGIANLMNAVSQKDTEILALKEKISTFDTDTANEKQKANRLLEEIAQWSATVSEKEKLVQNLEEKLSELSLLEAEIVNLKNIVSNKQNENITLKEQIGMLNANAVAEKQELGRLKEVVAQSSSVLEEKENIIVDLERQLSAYSESMKELEARNANLKVDISLKGMEILSLKEELSSLDAAVSSEKQETLRLQKEIAQWCGVGKEQDQTIKVSKEEVSFPSTLTNNDCVNNNEVEINNLMTNLSDKNNEITVLNELVTSLRTDLANRIQEINKLEEEIAKKSAVTEEKEQKILKLEEQLKSILGEITSRHVVETEAGSVNQKADVTEKNEVRVLDELISVETAAADNLKYKGLKEEKQFTSKSSLSVRDNLELSQGQIYENNRAVHLLEEELSSLSKKLGEESELVQKLQHENKTMKNKLIEMVEHRKHLVSEILALDSKFERDSLEEYQLSELLKTFCSCIMQKEEEVLGFQIQQHELLVEEKNRLTSRLECLESELLEKENEYKNLLCAYEDARVAKDNLTSEVEKKISHLDSVKNDLVGATKEIEQLNCNLSSLKTFEVIFDKLLKNLSAVPELNVHSGHDVLQAVNVLIDNIQNPQTVKDLKWKDCLKEIFEGDNEVKELFESFLKNKQNLESEKDDVGYAVESRASSYSFCRESLAKCHLTNSVQETNVDSAKVFEIASEIDGESNLAMVIRSFIQRLIAAKEYDNKNSILTEQLDCMKQQNELLKKHLDSLLAIGEPKKEVKAMENVMNEIPELVSNTKENNSHSLLLNMNSTKQGNKPVLKVVHELQSEEHANNTEWEKDGTERIAIKMTLLKKLEEDINKITELLASVTELDRPIDIVSSVDMLIKNLRRSWEITEEVSSLRAENDSLRKETTVLKSDIREIELMLSCVQDEVNSDLAVKRACFMKDGQRLKDIVNAKLQITKEMEIVDRDISELLSSVPELDLGNSTVNAVQVLVENFISSRHFTERMNKLEEERSFSKQESIALQKRLECLTLDLQGKVEECDYLQNVLSSQQTKVEKLEGEISHYSEYVEKLEIDARKIFELSALEPGLGHQNNAVTAFTIVLEKLHTAQKLNEDKFKLEIEFAKVRKENEDMKKEIVELKQDVQAKKEELFKTQREIENKQITENEVHCIQILKEELEALKRDLHDFEKESLNDCETLLMFDQNSAEDLVLAVRFLFQKFKAVKNVTIENVKLNKILNELKQENSIMKKNLESLTSEIEKERVNNNDLMKALNNVQAGKEELLLEMEETVNSKQFEIKALKDSLNSKSAVLHTMEDVNAKINTLLSSYPEFYCNTDIIASISAMIKRLEFCRENHETKLKDENLFLRQENEAMQKQIDVLKSDIESQKQTCKHLSETVHKLQTNINEFSSKEIKESSNWESFKEEIITRAQCLEMTMEPDLIGIYEQIINIPETDFPRNLIPLVTLLTDKLAKQDLKNRVLNNKLYFQTSKHEETLKEIRSYETEIYQMEEKIENLSIAVKQEREQAENLRSEKVRLQEEVAALKVAKKQLDEASTASEKLQTAEKWLAEREEVIANLRLAEKQFSDLGYKRQGDIITRVGSKCSPYQIGSSAKLRIKKLEEQVNELRRQLLEQQEGASGRSMVSVGVNTVKGNECGNCLASQIEIRNLKFEILGHKSKVELLKDQIEREEMKYKEDAEVFERKFGAAKSKIGELKMEIRRLQAAQEVSFVAGARKKQPAINMCDQQIQTDKEADVMYRMSGEGSGIVNDYIVTVYKEKVTKLQHENELLKELSRRRLHKIRLLQGDKEEMEKIEGRKENIDSNVNSGKTSDSSTHKRKKPASSSHS